MNGGFTEDTRRRDRGRWPYAHLLSATDGSVLIETVHGDEHSLRMEVMASSARIAEAEPNKRGQVPGRIDVDGIPEETCRRWIAARPARGESAVSDEPAQTLEARLIAFLAARLDETQKLAQAYLDHAVARKRPGPERWANQTLLRAAEADRAILDLYARTLAILRAPVDWQALAAEKPVIREMRARDYLDAEREACVLRLAVLHLAAVYSDYPGYDPGWKP